MYASVDSYKKHVYRNHRHVIGDVETALPEEAPDHLNEPNPDEVMRHEGGNESFGMWWYKYAQPVLRRSRILTGGNLR